MTPRTFGNFTIVRKLPAGGMGRVYESIEGGTGRRVALKLIEHGSDPDSLEIVAAERHGAILQARLCALDERVTLIHAYGDRDDHFYIVMEYVDGQDLSELMTEKRIGWLFAARIAQDVCEVLQHAHDFAATIEGREYRGIVHGDIKPRNIRLTGTGGTKVLDFGIAKALSLTRRFTHNQFGSVQYSSPERLNSGEVDARSDLWSVGIVLYELVARQPYFHAETTPKLEHLVRNYRQLRPLPAECPEELQRILTKALAPNVDDRYATAEEFARDLRDFRTGTVSQAVNSESTRRISVAGADSDTTDTDATRRISDSSATHRTATVEAPPQIDEATRKTRGAVPKVEDGTLRTPHSFARPMAPPPRPGAVPVLRRPVLGLRLNKAKRIAVLVFGLFMGSLFMREYVAFRDAQRLAYDLESERYGKLDDAWSRYEELARKSSIGLSLSAPRKALRNQLLGATDRTIQEYRDSDIPRVSQKEWEAARANAARALQLLPGDRTIRGKLRICEAHIDRIRGTSKRDGGLLESSRVKFQEAAELLPRSPDPQLGLAWLYAYALPDAAKAEEALRVASDHGHRWSKRETAELADAYRARGDRAIREAENTIGLPEEEKFLNSAHKDLERARDLYQGIAPFGSSTASLRRVYDNLDLIARRRAEIEEEKKQ
jgi:serine/threonine protein kinase